MSAVTDRSSTVPSDRAGLLLVIDNLTDQIGDLAAGVREFGISGPLDEAKALLVQAGNTLDGTR